MIEKFITRFNERQEELKNKFSIKHISDYAELVRCVVEIINSDEEYGEPDPNRIHVIDDGDYQGTLVYVIGANGYQPDNYWYVKVGYGSCSGCDTLQAIHDYSIAPPTEDQVHQYMTLALHIVQKLAPMNN